MSEKNKSVSQKIAALEALVDWFESDEFAIEAAMAKFDEAKKLAAEIEAELAAFKNQINEIKKDFSEE